MTKPAIRRDVARADIIATYVYIFADNPDAAERWLDAVDATIDQFITRHPLSGVKRDYGRPKLAGMRMMPVMDFPNYLIFYRVDPDDIRIVRVLHGARDIPNVLESTE